MELELFSMSWENLFEVIRNSEIKAKGNFWAAVQSLEEQHKIQMKGDKN